MYHQLLTFIVIIYTVQNSQAQVAHTVKCSKNSMTVKISTPPLVTDVYLENLKTYTKCLPKKSKGSAVFNLPLDETFYLCGTTKVLNKLTGSVVFYHRVVVEIKNAPREVVMVKCDKSSDRSKRDLLPPGFFEQEIPSHNITVVEKQAPTPELTMEVKQAGRIVGTELTVKPGTPLTIVIKLDTNSSRVYGLLTNFMDVSDTKSQKEVIIAKGCSVDTFLFENFRTDNDGDTLTARFRAFKFPESTYVLFLGRVNVCLGSCQPKQCRNGDLAFGRKKRAIPKSKAQDPNMLFEVTMTTYIHVKFDKEIPLKKGSLSGYHHAAPNFDKEVTEIKQDTYSFLKPEDDNQYIGEGFVEPIGNQRTLQYTEYKNTSPSVLPSLTLIITLVLTLLHIQ